MAASTASATPSLQSLDQQLCFDLYAASRAVTARYRTLLEPLGLTYPQYLVMVALWEHGRLTMTELGRLLQLDSGTLSPLVRRLEADGLVVKRRRAEDERSVEISATASGRGLKRRAARVPERICAAMGLEPDEVVALQQTVRRLTANVSRS